MNNLRLRNLTTGLLHTKMEDIYEDVEFITGEKGVMTHQLPNAFQAMQPWLKNKVKDSRFWDDKFDVTHEGDFDLSPMTPAERHEYFQEYAKLPSPFELLGKNTK